MPKPGLEQIKAVFVEAVEKTGAERQAFLHQACGDDAELLAEVEAFLSASERAENFLESPTPEFSRESVGSIIGQYKLLELIGEGGFGSVFMAEQERPVRRKVALKIIKLGMDTRQVIARFEAERQALAMMDHPNISKVYEAGATETGRPYFVMELVRGVPITEHCDSQKLTTNERVELFIQVCQAIQHAHQKGVIHRDIKPNNVLVTMHDDKAVPKVIDFGIAKATGQNLTDKTLFTEFRQFVGTPAYMSPEQAQMNELDVDTRSDIYSLGVLLYELLTGTTPFDPRQLRSAAHDEIRRIIREVDPPKPSTRISTLGETLTSAAANRRIEPSLFSGSMKGELDWIVMKAMDKDRTRRYETANGLTLDIQRYLNNEPIVARPSSAVYRFGKLVRRNKLFFGAAAAVSFALIVGICASTLEAFRANRARENAQAALADARAQRDEAVKQRQIATAVNNFLGDMLSKADPRTGGMNVTVSQAIDSAVKLLDAGAMKDQPLVEASLRLTIARTQSELQLLNPSLPNAKRAIELYRQEWPADRLGLAEALFEMGRFENAANAGSQTEPMLREALQIFTTTPGASDKDIAYCLNSLATSLSNEGKNDEAEQMARRALGMFRKLGNDSDTAWSLVQTSEVLQNESNYGEAEQMIREALRLGSQSLVANSTTLTWINRHLARVLMMQGRYIEAEPFYREALAITSRVYPPGNAKIARSEEELGWVLTSEGKFAEAEPLLRDALAIDQKVLLPGPGSGTIVGALRDLGNLLAQEGKLTEAEQDYRQALAIVRAFQPDDDGDLGAALLSLGYTLMLEKKYAEAESYTRQAVALLQKVKATSGMNDLSSALSNFAYIADREGKNTESESLCRQALDLYQKLDPPGDLHTVGAMESLANVLSQEGKFAEADRDFKQALLLIRTFHPDDIEDIGDVLNKLGFLLMQEKEYEEAESALREALPLLRSAKTGDSVTRTSNTLTNLGDDLRDEKKYSESESLLRQTLQFDQTLYAPDSWAIAWDMIDLGVTLDAEKRFGQAEAIDRQALVIYSNAYSVENENIASAEENLGDVLCEEGKYSQSEPLLRHALEFFKVQPGIKNPNTQDTATYLAILLDNTHRGAEAAALRREFAINPTSQTAATESSTMPSQFDYP